MGKDAEASSWRCNDGDCRMEPSASTSVLNPEATMSSAVVATRNEKRKARKKVKRKLARREAAELERLQEEHRLNDPEEQRKEQVDYAAEKERNDAEIKLFEERERLWLEEWEKRQKELEESRSTNTSEKYDDLILSDGDEDSEHHEGPPEIIWKGNEIIIKKKRNSSQKQAPDRPISNPFPPESEPLPTNHTQTLESLVNQVPKFGTEQDKEHCPFHLKTGACRFGQRCTRAHLFPDKANTILIKNMYNGPGIAWEQDEGLEYTDEEVEKAFIEFYEDVHTEFLKFGELVNFKVCRNGSFHLRGNVYVHYKSLESSELAFHSISRRFFAGKQIMCEYVNVTRWNVAICGEYMKSRYKTCSHGVACNFIHCFRNPCGDYEWANRDKPAPRFWVEKMVSLFGRTCETKPVTIRERKKDGTFEKERTLKHETKRRKEACF